MAPPNPPPRVSNAVRVAETVQLQLPAAIEASRMGFVRLAYETADKVIQNTANELVARGNVTLAEARELVEVQRPALRAAMQDRLSPFGKFYSQAIEGPALTLEERIAKKGTIEAVLASVGKTRASTSRMGFILRRAGPVGLVLEVVSITVIVEKASPRDRNRVLAEEGAGALGGAAAGRLGFWGGGLAGAAWAGTWASPTLAIPVIGEFTEGGAILLGGLVGGIMAGWAGREVSRAAAHEAWTMLPIDWQ